jgi:uncharacterized Zn-binding protein involved in type VI secretion
MYAWRTRFSDTSNRVLVNGQPVVTQSDIFTVAGCPFIVGNKPQPCVTVKWLAASTRVLINGYSAVLQDSTGLCESAEQIPQGALQKWARLM